MKTLLIICGFELILAGWVSPGSTNGLLLEQRTQSFTISLNRPVEDVVPLFGPVREREWAPDWCPHFIQPSLGAQREGVVFTTAGVEGRDRIWLLTRYDVGDGRVGYVVVTPAFTANEVKIHVVPDGDQHCKATIMYRRSALAPEGNGEVCELTRHWAEQHRIHWETAINQALARRGIHD